jgi:glycerophosphoryl diester phosphodiesterase
MIYIELGTLIILSQQKLHKKEIFVTDAVMTTIRSVPRLIGFGMVHLIFLLLIMIPLIELPVTPTLAWGLDIPPILMDNIRESVFSRVAYWVLTIGMIYLLLRWIFTLHFILLERQHTFQAVRSSVLLTRRSSIKTLVKLIMMNLLIFGMGFGVLTAVSFIPTMIGFQINYLVNAYIVTFTGFIGLILTRMLMPINMIFLTRLYYQNISIKKIPAQDHLSIISSQFLRKIELVIQRMFRRRRTLLASILIINLAVSFYVGYSLNANLIYMGRPVLIAAHRGDAIHAPENSLSAIRSALESGADVIEFDVQMTADGTVVLHHDLTLSRMAGVSSRVNELTYEELMQLEIGSAFSEIFAGERIPTLTEALRLINGEAEALIDVKVYGDAALLAQRIVAALEETDTVGVSYVQSFDDGLLGEIRNLNPDVRTGQIMYYALGNLADIDVDFYTIQKGMLNRHLVRDARRNGRGIWVWTVNTEDEIKEVLQFDIDGIITSNVNMAREILGVEPAVSSELFETDE